MTTKVHTLVFVIMESRKGRSKPFALYFHRANAEAKLAELLAIPKDARFYDYHIEGWSCEDSIIYNKE